MAGGGQVGPRAAPPTLALVLVVTGALGLAGCSDDGAGDGAPGRAAVTVAPTSADDPVAVRVLGPGRSPAADLAFSAAVGEETTRRVDYTLALTRDGEPGTPTRVACEVTTVVERSDGDGIVLRHTFAVDDAAGGAGGADGATGLAALLTDTAFVQTVGSDGAPIAAEVETPDDTSAGQQAALADLTAQLARLATPVLPPEPVGVGGTWRVDDVVEVGGVLVDVATTYTLQDVDGAAFVIGAAATQRYRVGDDAAQTDGGARLTGAGGTVSTRVEGLLTEPAGVVGAADTQTTLTYDTARGLSEVVTRAGLALTPG